MPFKRVKDLSQTSVFFFHFQDWRLLCTRDEFQKPWKFWGCNVWEGKKNSRLLRSSPQVFGKSCRHKLSSVKRAGTLPSPLLPTWWSSRRWRRAIAAINSECARERASPRGRRGRTKKKSRMGWDLTNTSFFSSEVITRRQRSRLRQSLRSPDNFNRKPGRYIYIYCFPKCLLMCLSACQHTERRKNRAKPPAGLRCFVLAHFCDAPLLIWCRFSAPDENTLSQSSASGV